MELTSIKKNTPNMVCIDMVVTGHYPKNATVWLKRYISVMEEPG